MSSVADELKDFRADFTRCRTYGHAWFEADSDWKPFAGTPVTLRCERCMTERRDAVSHTTGALISRRYVYSDGYQRHWNDPPTREQFRLLLLSLRLKEARQARAATKAAASKATA